MMRNTNTSTSGSSSTTPSTVDGLDTSGDELRLVAEEPAAKRGNLVRAAVPLDLLNSVHRISLDINHLVVHWRVNRASSRGNISVATFQDGRRGDLRRDRIDANASRRANVQGRAFRQANNSEFGRSIRRRVRRALPASDA